MQKLKMLNNGNRIKNGIYLPMSGVSRVMEMMIKGYNISVGEINSRDLLYNTVTMDNSVLNN